MPLKKQEQPQLSARYESLVESGEIKADPAQREVLSLMEGLNSMLGQHNKVPARGLGRLLGKTAAMPRGIYIWGNVGRGKSMLMNIFFEQAPVAKKRRVHFHAFMQEVHGRIHQLRKDGQRGKDGSDPVVVLAQQIAAETSLLCFDELQATDVADATLLYRLFQGLFAGGVVVVSTSNHPPGSLYTGGVQRDRFAKFIKLLEAHMQVASLSSPLDYRHLQIKNLQQTYVYPLGEKADQFIADTVKQLGGDSKPRKKSIQVHGHSLTFPLYDNSIGLFAFSDLCEKALGAADYLALAKMLDTVILTHIPALPPEKRNEAKRFVTLIDALYEHKVRLICTAEVPPEQIYNSGDGAFEFQRTVSRLAEMQSAAWIEND